MTSLSVPQKIRANKIIYKTSTPVVRRNLLISFTISSTYRTPLFPRLFYNQNWNAFRHATPVETLFVLKSNGPSPLVDNNGIDPRPHVVDYCTGWRWRPGLIDIEIVRCRVARLKYLDFTV